MTPKECYEKYKHLDELLSDPLCCPPTFRQKITNDLWITIKLAAAPEVIRETHETEEPPT